MVDYGEDGLAIYADGSREERVDPNAGANRQSGNENGEWEETFNGHADRKPNGPMVACLQSSFALFPLS